MTKKKQPNKHPKKHSAHSKGHSGAHKKHHEAHEHHGSASHHRRKKEKPNYLLAVGVLVVLVAIVYGIIVLLGKSGEMRAGGDIAALVNDEPITVAHLDDQYSRIPAQYQAFVTKMVLLNQTINEVLLLQEAKKEGVVITDAEVQAQIDDAMQQAGLTRADLADKLAEQNLTEDFLSELYTKQLTINKLLEKTVFNKIEIASFEVEQYYDSKVRAAHILVEGEDEAKRLILDLQRTATDLVSQKFFELAEEKSIDPSAATNKGDLGEFSKGQMVPEFEDAAFKLKEGQFTAKPVQTQFGYHVILRLHKDKTFEEQRQEISDFLLVQKKSTAVPLYVEQLRSKAHVQVLFEEPAVVEE